jgi:uncharacterized protein YjbJ (UPF0337 family)
MGIMADQNDDLTKRGIENSVEGKTDNLKGKVKDAWGGATGDTSKQAEGKFDQLKGKAKDTLGKGERKLDE